jgi:hypothetical protein
VSRPFPRSHPGFDVPELAQSKSPKPHIRVMSATCGNPDCPCQQNDKADEQ